MSLKDYLNEMAATVHNNNVAVGWWTDIKTGQSILETRNRPEIMMLMVSELSEASEGKATDQMDDHLPQYPMAQVELADFAIRVFDLMGAEGIVAGQPDFEDEDEYFLTDEDSFDEHLMHIVNKVSAALEGYRKGNREKFVENILDSLYHSIWTAGIFGYDIYEAIDAKLEYNKNRADHKIANRLKDDGKKI